MRNIFTIRVLERLEALDLKRKDLAKRLKIDAPTVSQTINEGRMPQRATIERWARALETTPEFLMGVESTNPPEETHREQQLRAIELILAATASELAPALLALTRVARRVAAADDYEGSG